MTFGENLFRAFQGELGWIFFIVMICLLILFASKKEWTRAFGCLAACIILSVVIFDPEKIKDLGIKIWEIAFQGKSK
ncbi:hypothetical protein J6TS7_38130 [Paenibacillus dendritiformis]|uniref:hypothetical protein n=1 Tax=Paenibacillus TaxID=44249 RepID=UPI001B17AA6D|nr:hypothetical protein [Paenibacillus dendritiformis]GIO80203.1 hypothetical protein J6TS7_38130 [Paenibacillus dendritiformis]